MTYDVVTIGLTTLDVLACPVERIPPDDQTQLVQQIALIPAGTAGGTALIAARLGLRTGLLSAVGDDRIGQFVLEELDRYGVDGTLVEQFPGMPTSTTVLAINEHGQRPNFHMLGASVFTRLDEARAAQALDAAFIHWAAVGGPNVDGGPGADFLKAAKARGATVTCDLVAPGDETVAELERVLPHVDYFMPNLGEARQISGKDDPSDVADFFLERGASSCIFKWGGQGSYYASRDHRERIPAYRIDVVDTTSCGDAYCAGFIAGLNSGMAPLDACRFATATAAHVAMGLGTLGALGDFAATQAAMATLPIA